MQLLDQNGNVTELTGKPLIINGDAVLQATNSGPLAEAMTFDGDYDWLEVSSGIAALAFGVDDFTVEADR